MPFSIFASLRTGLAGSPVDCILKHFCRGKMAGAMAVRGCASARAEDLRSILFYRCIKGKLLGISGAL